MSVAWEKIVARYRLGLAPSRDGDAFHEAFWAVSALAVKIEQSSLNGRLFGWTSMHDLCIHQTDAPPFSNPYLRISPLHSGKVDFRFVDTFIVSRQWHRVVDARDTTRRFVAFLNQLKWVDRETADFLLQDC